MPMYEYYCSDCHTKFEVLRSMSAANEPMACSSCGSTKRVNRTISTFARVGVGAGAGSDAWSSGESGGAASMPDFGSGGCCGGGCGCG
ncbi:MAG TPA: zinc ribbon domain-containing protein [Chloroflexota bacterium]|nr:zinc ribbon domain-containing protein [Chloroflexota bacterium]